VRRPPEAPAADDPRSRANRPPGGLTPQRSGT